MNSFNPFLRSSLLCLPLLAATATLGCGGGGTVPYPNGQGALQLRSTADFVGRKAVAYSPFRAAGPNAGEAVSAANVQQDLGLLHQAGFSLLRVYDCDAVATNVLQTIAANPGWGMKVQIGAWLAPNPQTTPANESANQTELSNCIALATNPNYSKLVAAVAVGNENLDSWSPSPVALTSLVSYLQRVRAAVTQPVTYEENFAIFANASASLLGTIDFAAIHSYAIEDSINAPGSWDWQQTAVPASGRAAAMMAAALSYTQANYQAVLTHFQSSGYSSLPITIGETGWKATVTGGETYRASPINAAMYYNSLQAWLSGSAPKPLNIFYFEAFDEPWKGSDNGWGLFDVNRLARCAIASSLAPSQVEPGLDCATADAVYYIPTQGNAPITASTYTVFANNLTYQGVNQPTQQPVWNPWGSSAGSASAVGTFEQASCTYQNLNFCLAIQPTPGAGGYGWAMALTLPNSADDLSAFQSSGSLNFSIQSTYSGNLMIGFMTGSSTNNTLYQVMKAITPNTNPYGYKNNGQWVNVSIPISVLLTQGEPSYGMPASTTVNLHQVTVPFLIGDQYGTAAADSGNPSNPQPTGTMTVGNIYWAK